MNLLAFTENVPAPDADQLVAPLSDVVPLAKVKSSSQKALEEPDVVTVTDCWLVQPLAGFVTVTV
jgi:hypothetical protein